uniref:Uncharacterized protein n=1 Tax=Anguilla anguilla TaxID=7936 RepID=A0A0E9R0U9_ANGAN
MPVCTLEIRANKKTETKSSVTEKRNSKEYKVR